MGGHSVDDSIAIVGVGCRFPGEVDGPNGLWELLRAGTDAITEIPGSRWDIDSYYDPDQNAPGRMYSRWGGFLSDVDSFDADFFGITPREARQMDPQQRLLLETGWTALENAGIVPGTLAGSRTAVFTASLGSDYLLLHARQAGEAGVDPWHMSGKEASFGPGRLSYLLGLNGPAMSVSTACSSSLVGLHLARQSLLTGESDLALVGGASLQLSPDLTMFMCRIGAMSRSGRCRVFDAGADGIVRGDGCAMLVLKRLDDARADRDDVLAVLRGSAVNHDGRSAGLTVPNGAAQQELLKTALRDAGVSAPEVSYVEAHGTGTPLGDPVEVGSLARVYGEGRSDPLLIGSVKTNFGHTDSVSGVAGLLKASLAMRHGVIPAHLHLDEPNPAIRWKDWPVEVPTEAVAWPGGDGPRLSGVSSFGLSGTNAHVILQAAPARATVEPAASGPFVLPLSARTGTALRALAEAHHSRLGDPALDDERALSSYVDTAGARRTHHDERRIAVTGRDAGELGERLAERLDEDLDSAPPDDPDAEGPPPVVFAFSGQGAQWPGMATGLLDGEPVFAEALRRCDAAIAERAGWSVIDVLRTPPADSPLTRTEIAQPSVFAVQVALAQLWRHWGVAPAAVVGHSMGEITAAHVAGVLTLSDAADIIVRRGRLLQPTHGRGRMASIRLPDADVAAELSRWKGDVSVSAVNGPTSTVVSGRTEAVRELLAHLTDRGVSARMMPGEYAFHTPELRPLGRQLAEDLSYLEPAEPAIPLVSTTDGARPEALDADHWGRNVSEPVRFGDAVGELVDSDNHVFLEVSAHPVLVRPILENLRERRVKGAAVGSLRRDRDDHGVLGDSLATLYESGVEVAWSALHGNTGPPADLPTYPWRGQRLWFPRDGGRDTPAPVPAQTAPAEAERATRPREPAGRAPVAAADDSGLVDLVAGLVAEVLGSDSPASLRRSQGFMEMGMDSVSTVALAERLSTALGVHVAKNVPFDHPTIRRLADHLAELRPAGKGPTDAATTPGAEPAVRAAERQEAGPEQPEQVAVVGIGCRLPGSVYGPDDYWRLLRDGVDAIGPAPESRFPDGDSWQGGYLDAIDEFDAAFFRIPPREARGMDPQQRVFLEVSWEALEHAGIPAGGLSGSRTGVYVGMNSHDYAELVSAHRGNVDASYGTGVSFAASAGRLSYFLGLNGPSLALDTACSSSLVAVHQAMRGLRSGECDLALAGGVNLIVKPVIHESSGLAGALAADGRCKAFDASADGYTRAEGCGVVVLKPLSAAMADGDRVYAVLRGSSVNNDGASGGLTVPNGPAQEDVLRSALADAGVEAADVDYVEAHGTGTQLGDPIELTALGNVLGARPDDARCLVGSAKTNIGHLEAASGIAGLIKAALAVHHGRVPRQLHTRQPTPAVSWSDSPLRIADTDHEHGGEHLVAGVSAFGLTGTNAHVVLATAPAEPRSSGEHEQGWMALPLSAPSANALPAQAETYRASLAACDERAAAGLCRTAALLRTHFDHRMVACGASRAELLDRLDEFLRDDPDTGVVTGTAGDDSNGSPVFVFSGYGSQWPGMGAALLETDPVFTDTVRRCDEAFGPYLDWSVLEALRSGEPPESELNQQLTIFTVQVGLFERWRAWGVRPAAVVGHSMGEVAAAYAAGVFDLRQAAEVMARRTRLLRRLTGKGGMALVGLPEERVALEIADRPDELWVSVVNSGRSTVVSGNVEALRALEERLRARDVFVRTVTSGGPGHSPFADPLREELVGELAGLAPARGDIPLYSSVRARRVDGPEMDAAYWGDNIREPVRFADAVRALIIDGHKGFLELAPHPILSQPIEQELVAAGERADTVASLRRGSDCSRELFAAAANLHVRGYEINWDAVLPGAERVTGPRYAWQHRRYWVEHDRPGAGMASVVPSRHPLLSGSIASLASGRQIFEAEVTPGLVNGHRGGRPEPVASAVWLELLTAAAAEVTGHRRVHLRGVELSGTCGVAAPVPVQLDVTNGEGGGPTLRLDARSGTDRSTIASGGIDLEPLASPAEEPVTAGAETELGRRWEKALADIGTGVSLVGARPGAVEVLVDLPPSPERWKLHPGLLPTALELAATSLGAREVVPTGIDSLVASCRPAQRVRLAVYVRDSATNPVVDMRASLPDGTPVLRVDGMALRHPGGEAAPARSAGPVQRMLWHPKPSARTAEPTGASGRWLLLADRSGAADALARLLRERGEDSVLLHPPENADETVRAVRDHVRELRDAGGCRGVVHLWALDLPVAPPDDQGLREAARCYESVGGTAAALEAGTSGAERVWYVTRHGCAVGDRDVVGALRAPVWTLAGVAGVEHPPVWGGVLDLEPGGTTVDEDAAAIADEILSGDREDHVAVRAAGRFVARVEHADDSVAASGEPLSPRERATCLIAGGGGTFAASLAVRLAERGARRVVLAGASATGNRPDLAAELSGLGTELVVAPEGPESPQAAATLVRDIHGDRAPLTEVFWLGTNFVLDTDSSGTDPEQAVVDARSRALEAWNLHHECRDRGVKLDRFVVCTGLAAEWGAPGAGRAAVGDAMLGALVVNRAAHGLPALRVSVPAIEEPSLSDADSRSRLARSGLSVHPQDAATDLLERLTEGARGTLFAAEADWWLLLEMYRQSVDWPLFDSLSPPEESEAGGGGAVRDRLAGMSDSECSAAVLEWVLTELAAVLGADSPDDLEPGQGFFEMGMTSVTSLELRVRLERRFDLPLPATLAFEYPNAGVLAEHLHTELVGGERETAGSDAAESGPAGPSTPAPSGDDDLLARLTDEMNSANSLLLKENR